MRIPENTINTVRNLIPALEAEGRSVEWPLHRATVLPACSACIDPVDPALPTSS